VSWACGGSEDAAGEGGDTGASGRGCAPLLLGWAAWKERAVARIGRPGRSLFAKPSSSLKACGLASFAAFAALLLAAHALAAAAPPPPRPPAPSASCGATTTTTQQQNKLLVSFWGVDT